MKITDKIKAKLIHRLGGVTREESNKMQKEAFKFESRLITGIYMRKAEILYGYDAEIWCKEMYEFIELMFMREHPEKTNRQIKL